MQIKNMFEKQIDRDIKGVIKVGQSDEENVYQELDEYVVTKELLKHFRDFFNNYEKGVDGYTDKMGVWISGFFGSGKSHFLKILSYLLKNSTVEGKRAIEYFTDGKKIEDPMLIAEMTKAGTIESDVMLFNIDSKGSAKVGSGKEAIVEVFMKVFNEMQGYCGSIPYLAEFERQLDNEGRFEEFKEKFEANAGAPWDKKRQAFAVIQDKVVKTLVEMDFMSEEAARNWCKNAKGSYDLSIEKFVSLVQEYCAKKGPNHHVIFLVDEIGQYIADDTQLMLNLQTIVEDLGTACKGKAWVIVTSQEDIDSITKTKGNDFSKIQGRFDTRLSLSASNVDEVIRKRVLAKNETATQTLRLLYEQKESIIKNLITFTADTADKKLYADKADFADCYPFIPYQFNLLGQVLTAVRTHGASGKHLSDQSRSMLDGQACASMEQRDKILKSYNENNVALSFDEVANANQARIRELIQGKNIVYIYHNQVDARGDKPASENEVFNACAEAIEEIHKLVKKLTGYVSAPKFFITADHGFLYKRDRLQEFDKVSYPKDKCLYTNKRFLITEDAVNEQGIMARTMAYLNKLYVDTPVGADIFKVAGGGQNYVHGGTSLQEMMVPVIEVTTNTRGVAYDYVDVVLTSVTRKVTNLITYFDFIQIEKVTDTMKARSIVAYFTTEDGEKISFDVPMIANSREDAPEKRTFHEKFTLKSREYKYGDKYYLVLADANDEKNILQQYEFMIDIAFVDDFGF